MTAGCKFCEPHEFVPFHEDWDEPDSECEYCGQEKRHQVHELPSRKGCALSHPHSKTKRCPGS